MLCEEPENKPSVYCKLGFPGGVFLVARMTKNLPAMWETWVQSLCWEGPLEKGKTAHSRILAWRIPWTSTESQRVGRD